VLRFPAEQSPFQLTAERRDYLDADALIVGSSIKHGGVWSGPIDESRASELARAFVSSRNS
jgi:predicted TIM-barrel enzyme